MIFLERYSFIAVIMAGVFSLLTLTLTSWRKSLAAFAFQYLAVAWLCAISLSPGKAGVKLLAGVMAAVMLAAAPGERETTEDVGKNMPGWIFRLMASLFVLVVIIPLEQEVVPWIPGPTDVRLGGMILVGMGLMQLGFASMPGRAVMGLLTFLAGFEILYSALENSVTVIGLLAAITLGLAFTGAVLLNSTEAGDQAE